MLKSHSHKLMKENSTSFAHSRTSKIVFILSIAVAGYWCLGQLINVYRFALLGAIFEMLWLPALAMLVGLPIISLIVVVKEKFTVQSLNIYSMLITISTILFLVFRK